MTAKPTYKELERRIGELEKEVINYRLAKEALSKRTKQIVHNQMVLLEVAKTDYSDLDSALKNITKVDAETLCVERVSIWFFNEDRSEIMCENLYSLSRNSYESGLRLQAKDYPRYFQALEKSRTIAANDARTDPCTNEFADGYLKPLGITSMMDVPVRLHGEVVGIICHEHIGPMREWTLEEQDFVASIADMLSLAMETSERKRTDEALRKERDFNKTLIEASPAFFVAIGANGKTLMMNEAMLQALGYSPDDVMGTNYLATFVPEGDREMLSEIFDTLINQHQPTLNENHVLTKDGRELLVEWHGRPIFNARSEFEFFFGVGIDITKRKQMEAELQKANEELERRIEERTAEFVAANRLLKLEIEERRLAEEALRESEQKYRLLANNVIDTIWVLDVDTLKFSFFSPSVERVLGYTDKEAMNQSLGDMLTSESMEVAMTALKDELLVESKDGADPSRSRVLELELIHKNGSTVWTEVTATFLRDEKGEAKGVIGVTRDITDRKQAEKQVHSLTQRLIVAQEDERQRISRELHDVVAQDLSSLRIACETLFDNYSESPDEVKQKLSEVSRIIERSITSVRDLAYELRPPTLDQLGLVRTIFRYCEDFSNINGVSVDFNCAGIEDVRLDSDTEINLYRLVQEGLNNIRKHADASHVDVKLVASPPNIILRIVDNGKGFNVKERVITALSKKRMGFQSMEERVSLLQGKMNIKSAPMKGTRILIEVPYVEAKSEPKKKHTDH